MAKAKSCAVYCRSDSKSLINPIEKSAIFADTETPRAYMSAAIPLPGCWQQMSQTLNSNPSHAAVSCACLPTYCAGYQYPPPRH